MGSASAKEQQKMLQQLQDQPDHQLLQGGLELLAQLNLVEQLEHYPGSQLHLYAEQDALVPHQIVAKMQKLPAKNLQVKVLKQAAHSFPCFETDWTVQQILAFCADWQKN